MGDFSTINFYRLLIAEGVKAQCRQLTGTVHGTEIFPIMCPEISGETARSIADFCKGITMQRGAVHLSTCRVRIPIHHKLYVETEFAPHRFFHTGDLFEIAGPVDDPRYYRFVGRLKDIIARGGMKISPAELDGLLAGHPKLADAAVVGVPDPILGERVAAAVVAKPGEVVVLDDVVDFLKARNVAVFKLPESLRLVEELPRNPLGKVLRHELAALFGSTRNAKASRDYS